MNAEQLIVNYVSNLLMILEVVFIVRILSKASLKFSIKHIVVLVLYSLVFFTLRPMTNIIPSSILLISEIVCTYILVGVKSWKKLLYVLFTMALQNVLFGLLITFVLRVEDNSLVSLLADLFIFVLVISIGKILSSKSETYTFNYSTMGFIILSSLSIMSLLIVYTKYNSIIGKEGAIVVASLIIISIIATIILSYVFQKKQNENTEYYIKINQQKQFIENQERYVEQLNLNYDELRKFRHDIKSYFYSIQYLAQRKEYDKLEVYVDHLSEAVMMHTIDCSNVYIAAIINSIHEQCKLQEIEFKFDYDVSFAINIDSIDLSIFFFNLLTNAVEASVQSKTKKIHLSIRESGSDLLVVLVNTYPDSFSLSNLHSKKTSKSDKVNHGFGLGQITDILLKYNGIIEYEEEDRELRTKILFQQVLEK